MTKIKLVNGTIVNASAVELDHGALKITTSERTVEELAELFTDKSNTSLIKLLTESGKETGFKTGFTSFAGIVYLEDGSKVVELFQPADVTEARISNAEGAANEAVAVAASAEAAVTGAVEAAGVAEKAANVAEEAANTATETANEAADTAGAASETASNASDVAAGAEETATNVAAQNEEMAITLDSILTEIIPSLMAE